MAIGRVSWHSLPFGTILLVVLAFVLYVLMLAGSLTPAGGGDAVVGEAFQMLFLTFGLWILLAILLFVGGIMGEMPRSAAVAAFFLHPVSSVAVVVALDMCSRRLDWAVLFPVLLPLIIALYAIWARLPSLHAAFPPRIVSAATWGGIFILSMASFWLATEY